MKRVMHGAGAVVVSDALFLGSASPARAAESVDFADRLTEIALVEDAVGLESSPLESVAEDGAVTVGVGAASSLVLELPTAGEPVGEVDGRFLVGEGDAAFAVTPTRDGAQVLVGIDSAEAPTRYAFGIDVPDGHAPTIRPDGSVEITDGRTVVARVAAPWAVDAAGRAVPTRFEVSADGITQVVEHRVGRVTYPVVADPKIYACDLRTSVCVKFSKKETKKIAKKASSAGAQAFAAFLCTKIPHPMVAGACVGTVVAAGSSLRSLFKTSAKKGKCAELHFLVPSGLLWKWKSKKC